MKLRNLFFHLVWVACSLAMAAGFGELLVRWLKPAYDHTDRALMFSSPTFRRYSSGAVRFLANETIREVAVYSGRIEYDVTYRTNNLGFVDDKNYYGGSRPETR